MLLTFVNTLPYKVTANVGDQGEAYVIPANSLKEERLKVVGGLNNKKPIALQVFSGSKNKIREFVNGEKDDFKIVEQEKDLSQDDGPRKENLFIGYKGIFKRKNLNNDLGVCQIKAADLDLHAGGCLTIKSIVEPERIFCTGKLTFYQNVFAFKKLTSEFFYKKKTILFQKHTV